MDNVYVITIKYSDEINDHTRVVETYYPSVQIANQAAWGIFDQYLDDLVEYWDKRGDEDKTNRYTRFIREIKELKTKTDIDESYSKENEKPRLFFSDIGGGQLSVCVKELNAFKEAV